MQIKIILQQFLYYAIKADLCTVTYTKKGNMYFKNNNCLDCNAFCKQQVVILKQSFIGHVYEHSGENYE